MAVGTIASRGTGFIRTVVVAVAVGYPVGEAYNVANTVPNILYDLLLGGVLSSVVVPLLVRAAHDDGDDGMAYAQRLVTIVATSLTVLAALAVALAPVIVTVYAHRLTPAQRDLATTFARFFLPQLLFYGLGAIYGAILNVRGRFAAPMWAPVLNNLVVIAAGAIFLAMTHGRARPEHLSRTAELVLGIGTTAGVVLQTVALVPALRRTGFRFRARFDWRGAGLRSAGSFAGWILGYVVTNQLGYVVIVNLATAAGKAKGTGGAGYSPYSYAFVLFSLPYAVVAVTVITAQFPAMSRSAAQGDEPAVASALASGLSLAAVALVPATAALVILGPAIGTIVFDHGAITGVGARLAGRTLAAFAIGLVPFSAFQMQLRAWLAVRDSRTPTLVNLGATAVNVVVDIVLYEALSGGNRVVGLGLGFAVSYVVGCLTFTVLLRRRMRPGHRTTVIRTHVRLAVASAIAAVPTWLVEHAVRAEIGDRVPEQVAAAGLAIVVGGVIFVALARRMRIHELASLRALLPGAAH